MKYTLRVPTNEQYAFIEASYEGNVDDAVERYNELTTSVNASGLIDSEWRRVLDNYLWGDKTMKEEEYNGMNVYQQFMIRHIKLSRARNEK